MKCEVIPTINVQTADEALARMRAVQSSAQWIQMDVSDGTLTTIKNWHDAQIAKNWNIKSNIELHLMVKDPAMIIRAWKKVKRLKRVVWQIEAPINHKKLIHSCRRAGLTVGLALAPETPVASLVPFLRELDTVLLLAVHPGPSGQKMISSVSKKIKELRQLVPRLPIEWDGGLHKRNAKKFCALGVSRLMIGAAIFSKPHPLSALNHLRDAMT